MQAHTYPPATAAARGKLFGILEETTNPPGWRNVRIPGEWRAPLSILLAVFTSECRLPYQGMPDFLLFNGCDWAGAVGCTLYE
jgi:hypothetical protein